MPRQGARRRAVARARAAAGEEGDAARGKRKGAVVRCEAELTAAAKRASNAACEDMEEALALPGETSEKLFELANRPAVKLAVGGGSICVAQDHTTTAHSGGVVWETALFLTRYLEKQVLPSMHAELPLSVVELGSGCGLLGLSLSLLGCDVLLTDQPEALPNLRANAKAARAAAKVDQGGAPPRRVRVQALSWGDAGHIAAACDKGPFNMVVASDVVFAVEYVEPLLDTIAALLGNPPGGASAPSERESPAAHTKRSACCWLCLQQRDPAAHSALLSRAPEHFLVKQFSFDGIPGLEAAAELDCVLVRLRLRDASRGPKRRKTQ